MSERSPEEIQAALDRAYRRENAWAFVRLLIILTAIIALSWWFFG